MPQETSSDCTFAAVVEKCMFCGNRRHFRKLCPAQNAICFKCSKIGHFAKVCRSKEVAAVFSIVMSVSSLFSMRSSSRSLSISVEINFSSVLKYRLGLVAIGLQVLDHWFSNWGPRSFWGPRDKFSGTAKHLPKKLKRRS